MTEVADDWKVTGELFSHRLWRLFCADVLAETVEERMVDNTSDVLLGWRDLLRDVRNIGNDNMSRRLDSGWSCFKNSLSTVPHWCAGCRSWYRGGRWYTTCFIRPIGPFIQGSQYWNASMSWQLYSGWSWFFATSPCWRTWSTSGRWLLMQKQKSDSNYVYCNNATISIKMYWLVCREFFITCTCKLPLLI